MANAVLINATDGDLLDIHYYCSDSCAKHDEHYSGWYGCVDLYDYARYCRTCDVLLPYTVETPVGTVLHNSEGTFHIL